MKVLAFLAFFATAGLVTWESYNIEVYNAQLNIVRSIKACDDTEGSSYYKTEGRMITVGCDKQLVKEQEL